MHNHRHLPGLIFNVHLHLGGVALLHQLHLLLLILHELLELGLFIAKNFLLLCKRVIKKRDKTSEKYAPGISLATQSSLRCPAPQPCS
jgi:hypothetical protein